MADSSTSRKHLSVTVEGLLALYIRKKNTHHNQTRTISPSRNKEGESYEGHTGHAPDTASEADGHDGEVRVEHELGARVL